MGSFQRMFIRCLTVWCIVGVYTVCYGDISEGSKTENAVEIQFYDVLVKTWLTGDTDSLFKKTLAKECTTYCTAGRLTQCGMEATGTINASNIVYSDEYPSDQNGDMKLKFYVSPLSGAAIIPKAALKEILSIARENVKKSTGYSIIQIDGTSYTKFPNTLLDVAIGISALVFVLLVFLGLVIFLKCRKYQNKKKARENLVKKQRITKVKVPARNNGKVGHCSDTETGASEAVDKKEPASESICNTHTEDERSSLNKTNGASTKGSTNTGLSNETDETELEPKGEKPAPGNSSSNLITEESKSQQRNQSNGFQENPINHRTPSGAHSLSLGLPPVANNSNSQRDLPPLVMPSHDGGVTKKKRHRKKSKKEDVEAHSEGEENKQLIDGATADSEMDEQPKKTKRRKSSKRNSELVHHSQDQVHDNTGFERNDVTSVDATVTVHDNHQLHNSSNSTDNFTNPHDNNESTTTEL